MSYHDRRDTRHLQAHGETGIAARPERSQRYAESTVALAAVLNPVVGYEKAAEIVAHRCGLSDPLSEAGPVVTLTPTIDRGDTLARS